MGLDGKRKKKVCSQTKINAAAVVIPRFQQYWEKMTDTYSYVGAGTSASNAFPVNLVITTSWLINTVSEFICLNHLVLPLQSSSSPKQCYCISPFFFFSRHILMSELQVAQEEDREHCTGGSQQRQLLFSGLAWTVEMFLCWILQTCYCPLWCVSSHFPAF